MCDPHYSFECLTLPLYRLLFALACCVHLIQMDLPHSQRGDFSPECPSGSTCCWLKRGVHSFEPCANVTSGLSRSTGRVHMLGMVGARAMERGNLSAALWVYNTAHTWARQTSSAARDTAGPFTLALHAMAAHTTFVVQVISTHDGGTIATQEGISSTIGTLNVTIPSFVGDIAVYVESKISRV